MIGLSARWTMIKPRRDVFCQNCSRLRTQWGEKRQEWNSITKEARFGDAGASQYNK